MNIDQNKAEIKMLLQHSNKGPGMNQLIDHMDLGGFFTAPCSGSYHLAEEGGLAQHSLNVVHMMHNVARAIFDNEQYDSMKDSITVVGLLHDLGKMGDYGKPNYVENLLKSGKRSDSKPYTTSKDLLYKPHEVRSCEIAREYLGTNLTEEEAHAIYFHNGKYTHTGYDLKETPLQMLVHFCDLWVSRIDEIGGTEDGND